MAGPEEIEAGLEARPAAAARNVVQGPARRGDDGPSAVGSGRLASPTSSTNWRRSCAAKGATVSLTARPDFDLARGHRLYIEMLRATTSARSDAAAMQRWRAEAERAVPRTTPATTRLMARGISLPHRDFLRRQRATPAHAPRLGGVLPRLGRVPVPRRRQPRAAARPRGRALGTQHHGERPSRAGDRPDVLGRHFGLLPAAGDGRAARLLAGRVCRSACRSSARNTPTAPRSNSQSCWKPRGRVSCRRRDGSDTHGPVVPTGLTPGRAGAQRRNLLPANCSTTTSRVSNGWIRASTPSWCATSTARAPAPARWTPRGDRSAPLFGVPMTVKESFDVAGLPTTCGHVEPRAHRAGTSALAGPAAGGRRRGGVRQDQRAGRSRRLAKLQSGLRHHLQSVESMRIRRADRPAARAAVDGRGVGGLEVGTDIGGSVRVPAHYCGVFGHKPTWALCPMYRRSG